MDISTTIIINDCEEDHFLAKKAINKHDSEIEVFQAYNGEEALEMLKGDRYKDADVLVVSDFLLPRVPQVMLDDIQEQRSEHGTRFHSLYISRRIDPRMIPASVFDHQWVYNLSQPGGLQRTVGQVSDWLDK